MPGTRPWPRRRRLAPVPCVARFCALISIFIATLLRYDTGSATRPRWVGKLFLFILFREQGAHRFLGVDPEYRFREQPGHRELADLLAGAPFRGERDGIRHHQL